MADVFISYKSERRAAAEHLAEILSDYGYSVWWDYGLISGRDFGAQIEKELRAAKAVVVLWCSMSVGSEWVREEAALAKRLNKVIPTFIEKNVDLPLGFSLSQTLDLADWDGSPKSARLDRLLRDIGALVGRAPKPNMEGLERTERAWRRFGAPPLREFALIDALERKLPPRTLPGALFTQDGGAAASSGASPRRGNVALYAAVGALALAGAGWGAFQATQPQPVAQTPVDLAETMLAGQWRWEGLACGEGPTIAREGDALVVNMEGTPTFRHVVENASAEEVRTRIAEPEQMRGQAYAYRRSGDTLTLTALSDGRIDSWERCP